MARQLSQQQGDQRLRCRFPPGGTSPWTGLIPVFALALQPLVNLESCLPSGLLAQDVERLYDRTSSAVVEVLVSSPDGTSQGDGFIIDSRGVIVTHTNVVADASTIFVKLPNEDVYERAVVLATDERRYITLLRIEGDGLPTLEIGNSDSVAPGGRLTAIGTSGGARTVASGALTGRSKTGARDLLQLTSPSFPVASGGAVLDRKGRVVGIAVGALREDQTANYAIAINDMLPLLAQAGTEPPREVAVVAGQRARNARAVSQPRTDQPVAQIRQAPTPRPRATSPAARDLSGIWELRNTIHETSYAPFRGLELGFRVTFFQDREKIIGRGEKWLENGKRVPRSARSRILIEGTLEEATLNATFVEEGSTRTINGLFAWTVSGDGRELRGRFSDVEARSSGSSRARKVK
jgi:S1-C subfamily serine protease